MLPQGMKVVDSRLGAGTVERMVGPGEVIVRFGSGANERRVVRHEGDLTWDDSDGPTLPEVVTRGGEPAASAGIEPAAPPPIEPAAPPGTVPAAPPAIEPAAPPPS